MNTNIIENRKSFLQNFSAERETINNAALNQSDEPSVQQSDDNVHPDVLNGSNSEPVTRSISDEPHGNQRHDDQRGDGIQPDENQWNQIEQNHQQDQLSVPGPSSR